MDQLITGVRPSIAAGPLEHGGLRSRPPRGVLGLLEARRRAMVSTTLFVRNLAYSIDSKALEDAFGAVGPVRSAFIVNGGDGKPRGIGFVEL